MPISAEQVESILSDLKGGKSLRKAAQAVGVAASAVLTRCEKDPDFGEQYARARQIGYLLLAEEILDISDDASGDIIETDNGPVANQEVLGRSRLRVDSRKWMLSKMLPKIYGDKLDLNHSGYLKVAKELTEDELTRIASSGGA